MASDGLTNAMLDTLVRDGRRRTNGGHSPRPWERGGGQRSNCAPMSRPP